MLSPVRPDCDREILVFRLLVIAVVSTFLLIPIAGFSSNIVSNTAALILVSVVTGYVIVPAILLKIWEPRDLPVTGYLDEAVATGTLTYSDFDVRQVISIAESEDEGLHFLLEVGPDQTLFLSGQYLYGPVEKGLFPSTKIRIYWDSGDDMTVGVAGLGTPVEAVAELPPFTLEQFESDSIPADRSIIERSIHDVAESMASA